MSKKNSVVLIDTPDFQGLYLNGKLFAQGRGVMSGDYTVWLLEELGVNFSLIREDMLNQEWFDNIQEYPEDLFDVQLEGYKFRGQ